MTTTHSPDELAAITTCPRCGSDDLGHCGATEERTDLDITDVVECSSCGLELLSPHAAS